MSVTKHKTFKLKIDSDTEFAISEAIEQEINDFLAQSNNVYINHSITTLTEDISKYDDIRTVCRYVLVSFVYKDLTGSSLDLQSTSEKIKKVVHKEIKGGKELEEPSIETPIDKEILRIQTERKKY